MKPFKLIKDKSQKAFYSFLHVAPEGLLEWKDYSKVFGGIRFDIRPEDGAWVAVSNNFRLGSIVTSGKSEKELDENIKDAILSAFEIPSVYLKEAGIAKEGERATQEAQYVAA